MAARALELGADGLVLASLPGASKFYTAAGGERRLVAGWKVKKGLIPYVFSCEILSQLKEDADELIEP